METAFRQGAHLQCYHPEKWERKSSPWVRLRQASVKATLEPGLQSRAPSLLPPLPHLLARSLTHSLTAGGNKPTPPSCSLLSCVYVGDV